jgi:hypothetical protein
MGVERLVIWSADWYGYVKVSWPVFICFAAGAARGTNKKLDLVLLPAACIIACFPIALSLPMRNSLDGLYLATCCGMCVVLFFRGTKSAELFPSRLAMATIILLLAEVAIFSTQKDVNTMPFHICVLGTFFITLFHFNNASLQWGVHNAKGGSVMAVPASVRKKNIVMLVIFLVIALLIGNVSSIHSFLRAAVRAVLVFIWKIIEFFGGLGDDPVPAQTPKPAETEDLSGYVEPDVPTNPIVPIFVTMLVVMFLIGVVLVWHNRDAIVKGIKKLIRKNDVGQLDLDFEEDIERVFSLKDLLKKRRRSVRDFLNRLLKRPERIEDMPDNRMKVRFTYHALLKKLGASKSGTPDTPLEVCERMGEESIRELGVDYSYVRYCETGSVPDAAADRAKTALNRIGRFKGKKTNEGNE